ncbi:MAG TPA: FAD-binding protein, partial [Acidimicrobiales bacterium]|nr:FAD-binding protein [Acidimicrobiales bacterium]
MNIAVLIKQVPKAETMTLTPEGRLQREGVELEMNAYCRRAVSKGVELAAAHLGRCVVFTLGPPAAEDVLREAVAWGADEGMLVCDPKFAGSDTLATSRALAAALRHYGTWDLVLVGRNSIDADTGQVGPQVAELLGLPFAGGVRQLKMGDGSVEVTCEQDDGWRSCQVQLPAVLSTAERLTEPCKVPSEGRADVAADRIRRLEAADLGPGPWGAAGSRTEVGTVRSMDIDRRRVVLSGSPSDQVSEAVRLLSSWGALGAIDHQGHDHPALPGPGVETVESSSAGTGPGILVVAEPGRSRLTRELLGEAAHLASKLDGEATVIGHGPLDPEPLAGWGADAVVELNGASVEEDVATAVADWCGEHLPWAGLVPGTLWGREVASRMAVRLDAGLTGDAVGFGIDHGRLVSWKPAFGGRLVAAITASSPLQLATVRPGILSLRTPRPVDGEIRCIQVDVSPRRRIEVTGEGRDDEVEALLAADTVVSVGNGVYPDDYPKLEPLLRALGAELAATRKVTDKGWLPRARQVGLTGQSVDPALFVGIGISGKFNHMVGAQGA